MDEFLTNIASVGWWASVVVVGLLVNFLSQFLYPRLAAMPAKGLGFVRIRAQKKKERMAAQVDRLRQFPQRLPIAIAREQRCYWVALMVIMCAVFVVLINIAFPLLRAAPTGWLQALMLFLAAVLFLLGTRAADAGFELGQVIDLATDDWPPSAPEEHATEVRPAEANG